MADRRKTSGPVLSVVTPAYNEETSLPLLYPRLNRALSRLRIAWEWIVVDDHSSDKTFVVMETLARKDRRVKVVRLARNSGSHRAILCGFNRAQGEAAAFLAADLQDPPELLRELLERWKGGNQVVWAIRKDREAETVSSRFLAASYYFLMRYFVGLKEMPSGGADFFLLDRKALNSLKNFRGRRLNLHALISSLGFRQGSIFYDRKIRLHGQSKWTLRKKVGLVVDSILAFPPGPFRWLGGAGLSGQGRPTGKPPYEIEKVFPSPARVLRRSRP